MNDSVRRRTALSLVLLPALGGCGVLRAVGLLPERQAPPATPPPPPAPLDYALTIELVASENINPDPRGRPSPLRVHVHVGERDPRFGELGFASAFGAQGGPSVDGAGAPGEPSGTAVLAPGARETLALRAPVDAAWVTVSAAYREPWSALWTVGTRVDTSAPVRLVATLDAASVAIATDPGSGT